MKRLAIVPLCVAAMACGRSSPSGGGHSPADQSEPWALTAWGEHFELFPETEPLIAGKVARSHTHVTLLEDFSPMREGRVVAVLRDAGRKEEAFEGRFKRDGIYEVEIRPSRQGEFDLSFRIETAQQKEEVAAGRVEVGGDKDPGGLVEPPAGSPRAEDAGAISFLKEQQWKTEFGTAWVREDTLHATATGPGRVRPAADGEVVLTAPVEAVVSNESWPYVGREVRAGAPVFRLIPHTTATRSLSELEADLRGLEAETQASEGRLQRLMELLKVEAVSQAEVERVRAATAGLQARREAARKDLASARAARSGGGRGAETLVIKAPWAGRIAALSVSPGESVPAGTALARLVKTTPVWLEVALRPEDARRLQGRPRALYLRDPAQREPIAIAADDIRLVSRAPEVDAKTSTVSVLFELRRGAGTVPFGTAVEAELVLPDERRGVVIPDSAIVDDGGVPVVYVQIAGETMARREVKLLARQGPQVLVDGLRAGERAVTRGGAAIRRAALLSTGAPEGHVH